MKNFTLYKLNTVHCPYIVIHNKSNVGCAFTEIGDIISLNIKDWILGRMQGEDILMGFNQLEEIHEKYPEEFI